MGRAALRPVASTRARVRRATQATTVKSEQVVAVAVNTLVTKSPATSVALFCCKLRLYAWVVRLQNDLARAPAAAMDVPK